MEPREVHIDVSNSQDAVIEISSVVRFAVVRQHIKRMKTQIARKFTKSEDEFDLLKNIKFINDRLDTENEVVDEWKKAIKSNLFDIMVKVSDVKKRQIAIDEYKERVIDRLCDVNDKMKELYFIAEDELKIINIKLKQKWRLFGRKGLRKDGLKLNGLLEKTSEISDNIVAQIEPLEFKMKFNSK